MEVIRIVVEKVLIFSIYFIIIEEKDMKENMEIEGGKVEKVKNNGKFLVQLDIVVDADIYNELNELGFNKNKLINI